VVEDLVEAQTEEEALEAEDSAVAGLDCDSGGKCL
jgi:hypothetical protein